MAVYSVITTASNLSQLVGLITTQHDAMLGHQRGVTTPTIKPAGCFWIDTTVGGAGQVKISDGTNFTLLLDARHAQINAGGTVAFAADQAMGGFKLTGLAAGSAAGHSVRYEQVLLLSGVNTMTGNLNMGSNKVTNLAAPTANSDAARLIDVYKDQNALCNLDENVQLEQQASPSTTFQTVQGGPNGSFVPLILHLKIKGTLVDQSDNDPHGSVDLEYTIKRWDLNSITLEDSLMPTGSGATAMTIELDWKTSAPRGFRLRIYRNDNSELQNVTGAGSHVRAIAIGAIGEQSG